MMLELNFGTKSGQERKGAAMGTRDTPSMVLLADSMVSTGVAKGLEQITRIQTTEYKQLEHFLQL